MSGGTICLVPPLRAEDTRRLRAGDAVRIDGTLYVARDAAHKRLVAALEAGEPLPFDPVGAVIYYMGRRGDLLHGALARAAREADRRRRADDELSHGPLHGAHDAVYLITTGGAAALIAQSIRRAEVIAYPELGPEAVRRLEVQGFPAIVAYDTQGRDIYQIGRARYRCRAVGR